MGLWGCNIKASTWCCNLAVPWGALTLMMLLEEMEFSPWRWKMLEVFVSCTVYQCISYIRIRCVQIYIFHSLLIIYIYIFAIRTSIAATSTHRSPFLKASNLWSEKHLSSKGLGLERITCFFFQAPFYVDGLPVPWMPKLINWSTGEELLKSPGNWVFFINKEPKTLSLI